MQTCLKQTVPAFFLNEDPAAIALLQAYVQAVESVNIDPCMMAPEVVQELVSKARYAAAAVRILTETGALQTFALSRQFHRQDGVVHPGAFSDVCMKIAQICGNGLPPDKPASEAT